MKKVYLIEGVSGAGKTTVGEELRKLGYKTIDGDEELADFVDPETGLPTDDHSYRNWRWNEEKFNQALEQAGDGIIFVCGGAMNKPDFLHHFNKVFTLHIDDETLQDRLRSRTNNDYGKKPDELAYQMKMNRQTIQYSKDNGTILIDATKPLRDVIDQILRETTKTKEFGIIFWLHLIIILAIYTLPFWLDWKVIFILICLYYFQLLFLGNCLLTRLQFNEPVRDTTFYSHYLSKLGLPINKRKLRLFLDYVMPWIIFGVALLYQLLLHTPISVAI